MVLEKKAISVIDSEEDEQESNERRIMKPNLSLKRFHLSTVCRLSPHFWHNIDFPYNIFLEGGGGGGSVGSARLLVRRSRVRLTLWPRASYWLGRCQYNVAG